MKIKLTGPTVCSSVLSGLSKLTHPSETDCFTVVRFMYLSSAM